MGSAKYATVPDQQQAEDDLLRLERGIRELKIAYDRFFIGSLSREPNQLKWELKKIIKRYNEAPLRSYGQRFRFNSLVCRFNVMSELWTKNVALREEGDRRHNANKDDVELGVISKCRVHDPRRQSDALRDLHREFVMARRRAGIANPKVPFDKFVNGIEAQTKRLQSQAGCGSVELRLRVKDRKVQLSARPESDGQ